MWYLHKKYKATMIGLNLYLQSLKWAPLQEIYGWLKMPQGGLAAL